MDELNWSEKTEVDFEIKGKKLILEKEGLLNAQIPTTFQAVNHVMILLSCSTTYYWIYHHMKDLMVDESVYSSWFGFTTQPEFKDISVRITITKFLWMILVGNVVGQSFSSLVHTTCIGNDFWYFNSR